MESLLEKTHGNSFGVYIHIPFCATRCHFCAFYLHTNREKAIPRFLSALKKEFQLQNEQSNLRSRPITSIYLGGGTPTILSPFQISEILEHVHAQFVVREKCEVTVEGTPESLTGDSLNQYWRMGVNRLSLGVQTFCDGERKALGLHHSQKEVLAQLRLAEESGIPDLNIDLLYGLPSQTPDSWRANLEMAMTFRLSHISCYALTLEAGTKMYHDCQRGRFIPMSVEEESLLESEAEAFLSSCGFVHYEVSNWALPGSLCRHNLGYWQGEDYVGFGPSAQSFVSSRRFGNVADLEHYLRSLEHGMVPKVGEEFLCQDQRRKERVVFGLRLLEGIPKDWVSCLSHDRDWSETVVGLMNEEWLADSSSHVFLTPKGRRFADSVGMRLL